MKYDIVLAGVGGQGILTIAYLLDNAAVKQGLRFKQSEVHGMAQRGGAVYSHMRLSDETVISDLIPQGQADMILGVEPLEIQRYLHYLGPEGVVVTNNQPFVNIPNYPPEEEVIGALLRLGNTALIDAKRIAQASKSPRSQNVAMIGAATPFLPFEVKDFEPIIREVFAAKGDSVISANLEVLSNSYHEGLFYKTLREMDVPNELVYGLVGKIEVGTFEPNLAKAFGETLIGAPDKCREVLSSIDGEIPGDRSLLDKLSA